MHLTPGSDDDGWTVPAPARLSDGTRFQLYKDGEALHAAYRAIASARSRIALEVYIFRSDAVGRAFAELLARRAREGLEVRVIYDSVGSAGTDAAMFEMMGHAGARLREFHPWAPWRLRHGWRIFNRDHRKLVVVDDELAVLGGQNLGAEYGSSWISRTPHADSWRDTGAGMRGPSVHLLSSAFERIWYYTEHGGPIRRAAFFHTNRSYRADSSGSLLEQEPAARVARPSQLGPQRSALDVAEDSAGVLASVPTPRSRLVPALQRILRDAHSSIDMTMAYFAPPEELVGQLCRSARCGVRVRLMLPGRSDVGLLLVAARAFYERLLAAGVEIYERLHSVLHAKTLCVDRRLSVIGSTNLDYRSVQFNCELSATVHSSVLGGQMHDLFEHDIRFARRIIADEWRHRPARDRIVQSMITKARYFL